jgi:Family of unknown function (DUF5677)
VGTCPPYESINYINYSTLSKIEEDLLFLLSKLIFNKLLKFDITLNDQQFSELKESISTIENLEKITINLNHDQIQHLKEKQGVDENSIIEFVEQKILTVLQYVNESLIPDIQTRGADSLLNSWKLKAPNILQKRRKKCKIFEQSVYDNWGKAIDLLEILISVCMEAGSDFQETCDETTEKDLLTIHAVSLLHGRACQLALEILTLMKSGWADGALARWRTLHEIVVTAIFIIEKGSDTAERYIAHTTIASYRQAKTYQEHYQSLGYEDLTEQYNHLKLMRDKLCEEFGKNFDSDNGWASQALSIDRPQFKHIEEHVKLEHLRPFYRQASNAVHAGFKSVIHGIGIPHPRESMVFVGSTIFGLADPGQDMAISIGLITVNLLNLNPNFDRLAIITAINKLIPEIKDEFIKTNKFIKEI